MIFSYIYALLSALFESLKDVSSKMGLKDMDEYLVTWAFGFFALPFLALPFLFISIPSLGSQYWIALLIDGAFNVIATILQLKAIKSSDLSITVPLLAFTPLFLLIMSPLILGQFPTLLGIFGVILIVIGSYVLNIQRRNAGYLAPFKAMLEHRGPRLMLYAAFLLSITSSVDKIGVLNSSPIFWALSVHTFTSVTLAPVIIREFNHHIKLTRMDIRILFAVGLFSALAIITQYIAITTILVPYVIAIKRTSTIMSVLFGYLIFKEKGIKGRIVGAAIMVLGVILITLS
ncbi:MAG: EamA family transporter [Methanobacterium sp.]